jgi:FkbM family methyltransferase
MDHPRRRVWDVLSEPFLHRIGFERLPVMLDTLRLRARARKRRKLLAGPKKLGKIEIPERKIVYIDAGTHRTGAQIAAMLEWFALTASLRIYGIEAHPRSVRQCRHRFAGEKRVKMLNYALVGPQHEGETATLYLAGDRDVDSSLFPAPATDTPQETLEVPAIRLSKLILDNEIAMPGDIVLLRMDIEGAEKQVIEDLVEAGMVDLFDGFYGMWNDLHRIDPALDAEFRALLEREKIESFTFNDSDTSPLASPRRKDIIRYDIETSIYHGEKRKRAKWKVDRRGRTKERRPETGPETAK